MLAALLRPFRRTPHVIEVTNPVISLQAPYLKSTPILKPGKWVRVQEKYTGIIASISGDGMLTVAAVNPVTGADDFREQVYPGNVRFARFSEIPKIRIPELTAHQAMSLGYY